MTNYNDKPLNQQPLLNNSFPSSSGQVKIHNDMNNPQHGGGHHDLMTSIPGGVDKARISPQGDIRGGTTQIGKQGLDW